MSAPTALYRRYRPDSFADVIGQEHVTAPLMAALDKDRVNHAYLFSGPRGCGKTTSARILARCLNCAQGPTSHPCGTCDSCIELARGGAGSLDVIEIDAASHGGVDDARDLRERATFAPIRDRYKIFIIDEAHMVTSAGFNALLKIVEEPPEHIKFIFATTEPDKVIGTIRSRTHHYPFRLVPPEPLMAYLASLCEQENVPVAPGVLSLVIRAGGGSVRDSLSVLDQLMAGAGADGLDYELAVDLLGYTHASLLDDVVEALAASDAATVFKSVDRVIQTGHDPRRFVEDLLERFRDLIIVQAMPESAHAILRGTPDELIARMQTQAAQLGASELSRAADVTNTAFNEMTGATSPRLHLELLGARLLLPGADASTRGMAARLDQMERRLNYGGAPAGTDSAAGPSATQPSDGRAFAGPSFAGPSFAGPSFAGQGSSMTAPAPSLAGPSPAAPGGGLAAVRAQLAKAKADAGAQVASRHQQDGTQEAPRQSAPLEAPQGQAAPAETAPAAPKEAHAAAPNPAETPATGTPTPGRAPSWDDLDQGVGASAGAEEALNQVTAREGTPRQAPTDAAPSREPAAAQAPGASTGIEIIRRAWPEILSNLSNIRKASWAMVNQNVVPRAFDGETLRVALPTTALIQTFGNSGHADNLRQAIHTTLGITCQLDPITGDAPDPGLSAEPNPKGPADPKPAGSTGRPPSSAGQATSARPVPGGTGPANTPASHSTPADAAPVNAAPSRAEATIESAAEKTTGTGKESQHSQEAQASAATAVQQPRPGFPVSDWDGPIPEEPSWEDEPPFEDWPASSRSTGAQTAGSASRGSASSGSQPAGAMPASGNAQSAANTEGEDTAPTAGNHGTPPATPREVSAAGSAAEPAQAPSTEAEPYKPRISSISAWTTGWDMPPDKPVEAPSAVPEASAAPRRSQLLAAQAQQSVSTGGGHESPQDWGVSLGGPSRNNVPDPGWGAPANAPDWAQPAPPAPAGDANGASDGNGTPPEPAVSADSGRTASAPAEAATADSGSAGSSTADSSPGKSHAVGGPTQPGQQAAAAPATALTAGPTASDAPEQAPIPASSEKLSMYQRLSNSPEAQAGRSRVQARPVDTPYVEDVPSPDDVTIEESGVAGQAAVERILGGQLVEERPLNGSSH